MERRKEMGIGNRKTSENVANRLTMIKPMVMNGNSSIIKATAKEMEIVNRKTSENVANRLMMIKLIVTNENRCIIMTTTKS